MNELSPDVTEDVNSLDVVAETTPEQEPTPTPDSVDTADSAESTPTGSPSRRDARIQQLVGDKKFAMEFATEQQEIAKAAKAELASLKAKPQAPEKLTLEDFDYDDDAFQASQRSQQEHRISQQIEAGVAKALEKSSQNATAQQANANWSSKVDTFASENADYHDVVGSLNFPVSESVADAIKSSDNGPALAYHLGNNPAEAARIVSLPQGQQVFALATVAASLNKPVVQQKQTTQAPQPMSPVTGQQPNLTEGDESIGDYMKRRNAEDRERGRI
jgi:hypothetical protein